MNYNTKFIFNSIFYLIKRSIGLIFPLLIYKYASKILGVDIIGKTEYANSIVSYFSLIATFGIPTFAIREGSRIRNDKEKFELFGSRIFGINIISTFVAYLALVIFVLFSETLIPYSKLIFIYSTSIILTTLGMEWYFNIYEKFIYITLRSLVFSIISYVLLLLFVKEKNDIYFYAIIMVVGTYGANIMNFFMVQKNCQLKIKLDFNAYKYIRPMTVLFFNNIATTIYVSSDSTMLGYMVNTHHLGLYSTSVKIYNATKWLIAALLITTLPRLSYNYAKKDKKEYNKSCNVILKLILLISIPLAAGMYFLDRQLILCISNSNFLLAYKSLDVLSLALICSSFGMAASSAILIPERKEKYVVYATIVGSLTNIAFNIFMIPIFKEVGAAFTTFISELIVAAIQCYYAKNTLRNIKINFVNDMLPIIFEVVFIGVLCIILKKIIISPYIIVFVSFSGAVIIYWILLIIFKNSIAINLNLILKRTLKNK